MYAVSMEDEYPKLQQDLSVAEHLASFWKGKCFEILLRLKPTELSDKGIFNTDSGDYFRYLDKVAKEIERGVRGL